MSVQTQIDRISEAVQSALAALTEKGVTVPDGTKVDGLAALIAAIEAGATLTVTAPALCTVTVSKDGKTKTKTAGADGVAVFKGLTTGTWTVTITDGEQEAQKTVTITADYTTAITFFAATIHITYPAGSKCTATDGVTTLTAPADAKGTWDCVVPNAGTWTVTCTDDADNASSEVYINTDGQVETIELSYNPILFRSGKLMDGLTLNTLTGRPSAFSISGDDLVAEDEPGGKYGFYFSPKIDVTDSINPPNIFLQSIKQKAP